MAFPVSGQSIDLSVYTPIVSLAVRERALWEKEQRALQQYERSVVERGRRLEEQRQKEMLRRSAVEEKRRQRIEEEKVRGYLYSLWGISAQRTGVKFFVVVVVFDFLLIL